MNASAKAPIVNSLQEIAKGLKRLSSEVAVFEQPKSGQNFLQDDVPISISDKALDLHDELVASLLKQEDWSDKFSERYIDRHLRSLYARFIQSQSLDTLRVGFDELARQYATFSTEHIVIIPLSGIIMEIDTLEIGRVTLRRATPEYLQQRIVGPVKDLPAEQVEKHVQIVLKGKREIVCAECRILAEQIRAEQRTFDECSRALDVLRYAIPELIETHLKASIGFEHDILKSDPLQLFTSPVGENHVRAITRQNFILSELKLNANSVATLDRIGALKLSALLKKPVDELTDFEKTVLRGLHWYSVSQKTVETENKFLNLTTCLETFFTSKGRDPISNAIAEGCAFVLSEDFELRRAIYRDVKKLYGQRSGLSHGGKTAILESELKLIERFAWELLRAMIAKLDKLQSRESLREWIEEQKFK